MITAIFGVLLVIVMAVMACISAYLCVISSEKPKRISYALFSFGFVMFIFHALFQAPGAMVLGAVATLVAAAMRKGVNKQQV